MGHRNHSPMSVACWTSFADGGTQLHIPTLCRRVHLARLSASLAYHKLNSGVIQDERLTEHKSINQMQAAFAAILLCCEALHLRCSRGSLLLMASVVTGWTMGMDLVPLHHLTENNLFLHAVHRHRARMTPLSSAHPFPKPDCGTGSFAYYRDNHQEL